ncbi:hypothetical protein PR048_028776 [Dryococelus australis]|uniref:Uncharacterized protein n=1 Tax=Dryococelus australis TaxID=614101 RepID=A0ABQ9GBH9_9NEOP|nr:hypothetical protein PR048_028776 [Dryococelus australis]
MAKENLNGVQAVIRKDCPKALYTHCSSHVLNLCLSYAAQSDVVRKCFFTISEILKDRLEAAEVPNCAVHNYNDTRWVERHDCVAVFSESFLSIVEALELGLGDLTARSKALGLYSNLCSFESIFLQRDNLDLFSAVTKIEPVRLMISEIREDCEKVFAVVYRNAQDKASKVGVLPSIPRRAGTQRFRNNVEASTPRSIIGEQIFKAQKYFTVPGVCSTTKCSEKNNPLISRKLSNSTKMNFKISTDLFWKHNGDCGR